MLVFALAVVAVCCGVTLVLLRSARRAAALQRQLEPYRLAADGFPGALLVFDRRLRHRLAAGRSLPAMGLSVERLEGRTLGEALPDIQPMLEPPYRAALEGEESHLELAFGDRDYLIAVTPVRDRSGRVVSGLVNAQDVTDIKQREHRLSELASRDSLTGAWNRRRLLEELEWLLRGNGVGSIVLFDLNGFKQVNDLLGHDAGDRLLRRVAQATQGCVRRADVVARIGGDEFAILLAGATSATAAEVATKIEAAIEAVWPIGIRGGASIGVAAATGRSAEDVLASADRSMYAAKKASRLPRAS